MDSISQQLFGQPRAIEFVNQNDADELETSLLKHHNALRLLQLLDVAAIPNQSVVSELDYAWYPDELVVRIAAHCPHWGIQTQHEYIFANTDPYIMIDNLFLDPTGNHIGTRLLAHQVAKAKQLGFQSIELLAVRGREANGYYTWARLGFNASFADTELEQMRKQFSDDTGFELPESILTLHDLMFGIEDGIGLDFWRRRGYSKDMQFDLQPNSSSNIILDTYLEQKTIELASEW
jgi:hypothetical protein